MKPTSPQLKIGILSITLLCRLFPISAQNSTCNMPSGNAWLGLYDKKALAYTMQVTPPGIEENFRAVIWPKLTATERIALQGVTLNYPYEDGTHPMNFYSNADGSKAICLPISSLRFLADVCLAQAYLNRHGQREQVISTYLSILKYQWPKIKTKQYHLLDALGIDREKALEEAPVGSLFGKLYSTAVLFVLCHELGHIRYGHQGYKTGEEDKARSHERDADLFALDVLRRIGDPPFGGILLFFLINQHFTAFPQDNLAYRLNATHPLNSIRLREVAANLKKNAGWYARLQTNPQLFTKSYESTADQIALLADTFDNRRIWEGIKNNGQSGSLDQLKQLTVATVSKDPFVGLFTGYWMNERNQQMPIKLQLLRRNGQIEGNGLMDKTLSWKVVNGETAKRTLFFNWKMGSNYFGQGELTIDVSGRKLVGWWGTKENQHIKKAGQLMLTRTP